jgi:uncharacterized protein YbaR (Trm112 family)
MDKRLLDILCCPVSKTPLKRLDRKRLAEINTRIARGELLRVDGTKVERALEDALVTEDGKVVYRIEDGIPVLLPEEGIGTTQLD